MTKFESFVTRCWRSIAERRIAWDDFQGYMIACAATLEPPENMDAGFLFDIAEQIRNDDRERIDAIRQSVFIAGNQRRGKRKIPYKLLKAIADEAAVGYLHGDSVHRCIERGRKELEKC